MKTYSISIDTIRATEDYVGAAKYLNEKIPTAVNLKTLPLVYGNDSMEEKIFKGKVRTFLVWDKKFENERGSFIDQVYKLICPGLGGQQGDESNQMILNKNFSMTEEEILSIFNFYPIAEMVENGIIVELPEAYYLTSRQISLIKSAIELKQSTQGITGDLEKEIEAIHKILS